MLNGGEERIPLSVLNYFLLIFMPIIALLFLVTRHEHEMSSTLKQFLSIPLLIAELLIPFGFSSGFKTIDLCISTFNFNMWLRFIGLFWVDPLVENKQVYSTVNNLWIELWSSMRDFPESKKRKNKASTDEKPRVYKKDREWYHIILRLLGSMVAVDLGASWITSFTSKETSSMPVERPGLFLVYYLMAITYTSNVFNCIGYVLQLLYCVFLEGGSYSSEQWRPLAVHPVMAESISDLWSNRWQQLYKLTWVAIPFKPTRIVATRILSKIMNNPTFVALSFAITSVFAVSGLMHEYSVAGVLGWSTYRQSVIGEQMIFFLLNAAAVIGEYALEKMLTCRLSPGFRSSYLARALKYTWTIGFGYLTYYYVMNGFIACEFYLEAPIRIIGPHIIKTVRKMPAVLQYFGSYASRQ